MTSWLAPSSRPAFVRRLLLRTRARAALRRTLDLLDRDSRSRRRIDLLRAKLFSLGFTEEPLADLEAVLRSGRRPLDRALAGRELAVWHLRRGTADGFRDSLGLVAAARRQGAPADLRRQLLSVELLALHGLGDAEAGRAALERAEAAGEVGVDALLAWSNFQPGPEARVEVINAALARHGIAPLALLPEAPGLPAYDRLAAPGPAPGSAGRDGPRVTVLMAAYEAAATIGTALRSLRAQTWADLEILVLDDASPTDAMARVVRAHAAEDPRIRLIRLERNGGAYIARNRGLDEATGELVTIHDADDWSHPAKIETQARFLLETPRVMGCTSEQARVLDDLSFRKLRGGGGFVTFNTSSFLFRRAPVREALGYWDTVRFGADNELIRRVQRVWGGGAFRKLPTGPLSFQRDAATSVTGDAVKGIDGGFHYYGVRRDYFDAQRHHHVHARSLRYSGRPGERPFGVAPMMLPHPPDPVPRRFDAVFVGEFRLATPAVLALAAEIAARRARGEVLGLVEAYDYRLDLPANAGMCAELRALVDGATVRALVYGEEAVTARLVPVGRPTPLDRLRFVPRIVVEAEGDAGPAAR